MTNQTTHGVDYQIGAHDIDQTPALGADDDFIKFEFESAAIFKRLADDIYKSDEAGIREPLSNAITAVRRAEQECGLDNGVIEITLHKGDRLSLVLQDNGIGISENVLREVLSVIGRSTSRDDGELSGKYGMGFLACYKLVGTDGGFVMHTNSRLDDSDPLSGIWKPGGFDLDTDHELPNRFDDDQYGTRFEYVLKDDVTADQIRSWVENHTKWSRVPVVYREFDANGNEDYNEDYGETTLDDAYDTPGTLTIETDHFNAVCTKHSDTRTLLLDAPIKRNASGRYGAPWPFDIRLKNENGVVVDGPNKGLMPVSEEEYRNMDADRRNSYIIESKLTEDDVCLPTPTGTRDVLSRNDEFWVWLSNQFNDLYLDRVADALEQVTDLDSYLALSGETEWFVNHVTTEYSLSKNNWREYQNYIEAEVDVHLPESVAKLLNVVENRVSLIKRGSTSVDSAAIRNGKCSRRVRVRTLLDKAEDGDVYMGVSLNKRKCDVIWADNEDNYIVHVDSSDKYDLYESRFGWKKVKTVRASTLDEFNVSDELKSRFESQDKSGSSATRNAGKDAPNRKLNIHTSGSGAMQKTVEDLYLSFAAADPNVDSNTLLDGETYTETEDLPSRPVDRLVLFPSNTERNLSDYYELGARHTVGVANCTVKVWDYLNDLDGVMRIEDYIEAARDVEFETTHGTLTYEEMDDAGEYVVFHCLGDETLPLFTGADRMERIREALIDYKFEETAPEDIVYVPTTSDALNAVRPMFCSAVHSSAEWSRPYLLSGDYSYDLGNRLSLSSDTKLYAYARLPEWQGTPEYDQLVSKSPTLTEDGLELVETFAKLHDAGLEPASASLESAFSPEEIVVDTSEGELRVSELGEYGTPLFHIVKPERAPLFRQDEFSMTAVAEYAYETASRKYGYDSPDLSEVCESPDDILYVPVTTAKFKEFQPVLESPMTLSGSTRTSKGETYTVGGDIELYVAGRLPEWSDTGIFEHLTRYAPSFSNDGRAYIETLAQLHDSGVEPAMEDVVGDATPTE